MDFDWSWWRFAFGAIGGCAPEVVRLYKIVTLQAQERMPEFSYKYFGISIAFVGLAGLMAVIWNENNVLKCFWIGISVPAIVSGLAATIPKDMPK